MSCNKKITKAVILAGGLGSRIRDITGPEFPKHLLKVRDQPIIAQVIDRFLEYGVREFAIGLHHEHQKIQEFILKYLDKAKVTFVIENELLGLPTAMYSAASNADFNAPFFSMNGDTLTNVSLDSLVGFFYERGSHPVMAIAPSEKYSKHRVVILDENECVKCTKLYPKQDDLARNPYSLIDGKYLVNTGLLVLTPAGLSLIDPNRKPSNSEFIGALVSKSLLYGFPTRAQYININDRNEYKLAESIWAPEDKHSYSEDWFLMQYRNPKPTTNIIILDKSGTKLCVTKRTIKPYSGRLVLPGGYVDEGELVESAAIREAKEETGLNVELLKILGVYSHPDRNPQKHTISTVFVAKEVGGELTESSESIPYWVPLDKIPDLAFDHNQMITHFNQWQKDTNKTFWSTID